MLRPDPKRMEDPSASAPDPASASVARRLAGRTRAHRGSAGSTDRTPSATPEAPGADHEGSASAPRATSDATADATPRLMIMPGKPARGSPVCDEILTNSTRLATTISRRRERLRRTIVIETRADPVFRHGDSSGVRRRRPTRLRAPSEGRGHRRFPPPAGSDSEFQNLNVLVPSSAVVTSTPSSVSLLASSMHASISSTSPDI